MLMDYANLKDEPEPDYQETLPGILVESAKCLVNVVMRLTPNSERILTSLDGPAKIVRLLKSSNAPKELRFPLGRLIFLLSLNNTLVSTFTQLGVYDVLVHILEESVTDLSESSNISYAIEALKCIFKLSMHLGPLNDTSPIKGKGKEPTPEEIEHFTRMIGPLQKILDAPSSELRLRPLKDSCVNVLINVPGPCTKLFQPEQTLQSLIQILKYQTEETTNPAQALTPILLVLTSIAKAIPAARQILKKEVFPNADQVSSSGIEAPSASIDGVGLSSKLIPHMTSFNFALKYYVNEFLFVICDEDANELVRMTGFGNAAGLLATYNLFSMFGGAGAGLAKEVNMPPPREPNVDEQEKEIEEATHNLSLKEENADIPSHPRGQPMGFMEALRSVKKEEIDDNNEDEDEKKARELSELMQKLEAQGIVKIMRKDDYQK
eukprot:TRINITY_DN5453_c0_g1_i1.p1 TRINITY_DN5453_c0_g1~~TRINITY_DN5453_c0_g1_i1.p1  ORF type:complete len:436 (-),score=88.53 TRINITY_DN5453_c0_g1_i1:69-1376(-)